MLLSILLAIVVPVAKAPSVPVASPAGEQVNPHLLETLVEEMPTEEFESKLRLIARGGKKGAREINRALEKAGSVGELTLTLPKGTSLALYRGDVPVLSHAADEQHRVRIVFTARAITWFVRRVIDWKTTEGVSTGVRTLAKDAEPQPYRVELSGAVGYELRKLIGWSVVPLKPFTISTAKDVEIADLVKITFGKDAVTAEVPLPTYTLRIPYAALDPKVPRDKARLDYDGLSWTLTYGDQRDVDFLQRPVMVADNAVVARYPKLPKPVQPDALPLKGPMQYWTPHDWNAWVGDCAAVRWGGRVHVFYLYDRRHHTSKNGGGGHYFAHISSADLVHWVEHPDPVPPTRLWEYIGTGMPIDIGGKLHLFYGLHTDRYGRGWQRHPIGGTYAVSSDGIHFTKSDHLFSDDQNPSLYWRADGRLGFVHSFCSTNSGEWAATSINGPWTRLHDTIPAGGDCPFPFIWNGWRYVIQGFIGMAASKTGEPGTWADWVMSGDDIYDGLCVPVSAEYGKDRRLLIGWITHPDGWGGWLCFRELIQYPDGKLGLKWVDEIPPPEKPLVCEVPAGKRFVRRFARTDGEAPEMEFSIDPATDRAQFADVTGGEVPRIMTLSERAQMAVGEHDYARFLKRYANSPDRCKETAIGKLRGLDKPYRVRLVMHYDPKAQTTIFDVEIAGCRTLLAIRRGSWKIK